MNTSLHPRSSFFGMAGCIIGLLALIFATLPHWALPKVFPPEPQQQVTFEAAPTLKERIMAKLKGATQHKEVKKADNPELIKWREIFSITAISLALLAIFFAVISILRHEPKIFGGVAATLGAASIAIQLLIAAIGAVMAIMLIYAASKYLEELSFASELLAAFLAIAFTLVLIPGVATFFGLGIISETLTIIIIGVTVAAFIFYMIQNICDFF